MALVYLCRHLVTLEAPAAGRQQARCTLRKEALVQSGRRAEAAAAPHSNMGCSVSGHRGLDCADNSYQKDAKQVRGVCSG